MASRRSAYTLAATAKIRKAIKHRRVPFVCIDENEMPAYFPDGELLCMLAVQKYAGGIQEASRIIMPIRI